MGNTNQVLKTVDSVNAWNNDTAPESGGNYWGDYLTKYPSAQEIDSSGIGDTAYVIDASNNDTYPLFRAVSTDLLTADTNGDRRIDMTDVMTVVVAFGSIPFHPRWNAYADTNGDLQTDLTDIMLELSFFGQRYP